MAKTQAKADTPPVDAKATELKEAESSQIKTVYGKLVDTRANVIELQSAIHHLTADNVLTVDQRNKLVQLAADCKTAADAARDAADLLIAPASATV